MAGTDPYGNVYPQGLSVDLGVISGTTINFSNGYINSNGFFLYSGTPATGNLIATFTFAAGTDAFSNKYLSGVTAYLIVAGTTYAMNLSLPNGQGFPGFSVVDVNNLPFAAPGVFAESSTSPNQAFAVVASGQATAADVSAYISVLSQIQSSVVGGQIVLQAGDVQIDTAGSLADMTVNATDGSLQVVNNTFGDGDTYKVGRKAATMASNQPITLTTPVVITNMQFNVATGFNYRFYFSIIVSSDTATAGGLTIGFNGSSVSGNINGKAVIRQVGVSTPSTVIFDGGLAGFNTFSPAAAGTRQIVDIDLWGSFSSSGAFNVRAQLTVLAATYHIKSGIAWKEIAALCLSVSEAGFTICMVRGILLSRCVHTTRLAGLPVHPGDEKVSVGIKKESKHWIDVPCPTCQGGKRYNGGKNCPLCKGKKKIKVPPLDEKD
jgi:hypothetical protein